MSVMEYQTIYINSGNYESEYIMKEFGACTRVVVDNDTTWWCVMYTFGTGVRYEHHRLDGPAMIFNSGSIAFYVRNEWFVRTDAFCEAAGMSDEDTFIWTLRFGDDLPDTCAAYYGDAWKDMAMEDY